jgi:hypothetical protein
MESAINAVKNQGMPIKTASRNFGVPVMSLKRRVRSRNVITNTHKKILGSRKTVFSAEQEEELVNYILDMEVRMYGLTTHDVRSLAYQLAERNGIANHPFSLENKIAGRDWLFGFQKRHPGLSLRVPEATSVARAKAFNKPVVSKFFDLLKAEYQKHNYPAHRIYNVDETSLSTVPGRNSKTFAKKGRKQVGRVTSAERGQSSTAVICMSAGGI